MPFRSSVENGVFVVQAVGVVKLEDAVALNQEIDAYYAHPDCNGLFLSDNSELKVIAPEAAEALIARMRSDAGRLVRSALVIKEGTAALQLNRMVRDSGSDKRRTFTSEDQALAWLLSPL